MYLLQPLLAQNQTLLQSLVMLLQGFFVHLLTTTSESLSASFFFDGVCLPLLVDMGFIRCTVLINDRLRPGLSQAFVCNSTPRVLVHVLAWGVHVNVMRSKRDRGRAQVEMLVQLTVPKGGLRLLGPTLSAPTIMASMSVYNRPLGHLFTK